MTVPAPPAWAVDGPSLDRTGEVWVGVFPGLGRIEVGPDGSIVVEAEPAAEASGADDDHPDAGEAAALREAALRHGWGEALSWARRGYRLASGAALCPPGDRDRCVVLNGDPHDTAIVMLALVNLGWSVMGDKYTPTLWQDGALMAAARTAPLLVAARRVAKAGLDGTKVRAHTDSLAVDLPRAEGTRRVAAFVGLRMRKPDESVLEDLCGAERFEAAATAMLGGALFPAPDDAEAPPATDPGDEDEAAAERTAAESRLLATESMAESLRLAAIPHARLALDSSTAPEDAEALVAWWEGLST